jgi:hypothetical protein
VTVAEGGTGVTSFTGANSGLIYQQTPGATTPLTKVNAALGASGFSFAPAISGIAGGGTVYGFESAATIATAGTSSAVVAGAHIVAPTVTGGGAQTTVYGALIDGPAYGTNRYGQWVNAGSTTTVGQVVNNPSGSTADNQQYRLNNAIVGNVGPNGRMGIGAANNATNAFVQMLGNSTGTGAVAYGIYSAGQQSAAANASTLVGVGVGNTVAAAGFTGNIAYGLSASVARAGGDTGTIVTAAALQATAPSFATTNYAGLFNGAVSITAGGLAVTGGLTSATASSGGLTQEAWTAVTFASPWANNAFGRATCVYMKDSEGFIHLRGYAVGGTAVTTIFTLPAGYRPPATEGFAVTFYNAGVWQTTDVEVTSAGAVQSMISIPTGSMISLSGISFNTV